MSNSKMKNKSEIINELEKQAVFAETKEGLVSVIIPVYGSFEINRVLLSIDSIKKQKDAELEIVVSEQGEFSRLANKLNNVKYIFNYYKPSKEISDFKPGLIRNLGVKASSGEFIYANDADVIFLKPFYLSKLKTLMNADSSLTLYRPPMRRLPIECFEKFSAKADKKGIEKAINSLDLSNNYLASTDSKERKLKVVTRKKEGYEKTFTASIEDFQRYVNDSSLKGKEPMIWSEDRHCGAIFMRRKQFDLVGSYYNKFINWGCEDSDLQWKLSECFELQLLPKNPEYEVLHLDHLKSYFSPEMWKKNEEICAERKKKGIIHSVRGDMNHAN